MDILIRTDGGPAIGIGHIVRTGTLAAELLARGHSVTVLSRSPQLARETYPDESTVLSLSQGEGEARHVQRLGPDATVLDLPAESEAENTADHTVSLALQRRLSRVSKSLVVIHDYVDVTVCCDVLVNSHLYADADRYDWVGTKPKLRLGPRFLIMNERLREQARREPLWRESPERVLVTMGGSDVNNTTPLALRALGGIDLSVDVIVGPGVPDSAHETIRETAAGIDNDCTVTVDPDDFAERLFRADLAVTALGITAYELSAVGTPYVGLPVAPDQTPKAAALRQRDAAVVLDEDFTIESVSVAVSRLVSNGDLRRRLVETGRSLVDPDGVERLCDTLEALE